MNILLVAVNAKYIHSNPAVYSLRACAGEYQPYVSILEFTINQQPSYLLHEIYKKKPDVVAFSCYIWNREIIGNLISDLNKILPDTDIWAGGPEVSYNASAVIDEWELRGVMTGPGEGVFYQLVSAYVENRASELPDLLDGTLLNRMTLDEIPFWYENLTDFEHRIIYYESSRGCPFSCSYCLSSIDKVMDFRSVSRVCHELDFFLERKVPQVKFVDRTFNCKKDHAIPVLKHILEHDNGVTNFHFEIAADLLDDDYFDLLEKMRPGAVQLEIGVQSTCPDTIREINRKMDFHKVADVVRKISSWNNIHIHLDLIAGLPFEDFHTFRKSFNDVYCLHPEQLQLGFLKVLKGSQMEYCAPQYHLIYTSLPPYEVLSTKWLSYDDICHLKQMEEVLEIYYNSGQFQHTLKFLCDFFADPFEMYELLASWYEQHDLFGIQSSRVRKYEILLEFGINYFNEYIRPEAGLLENDHTVHFVSLLKEYLAYDLYLRENMKNRPTFLFSVESWKNNVHEVLYKESETHKMFPELSDCSYRELTKILHVEVFRYIFNKPTIIIFYYGKRDPVTNNCIEKAVVLESVCHQTNL